MVNCQNAALAGTHEFSLNSAGFLAEFLEWSKDWADYCAKKYQFDGGAREEHMSVINRVRSFYQFNNSAPSLFLVIKMTGMDLRKLQRLFANHPTMNIAKMAGLPGSLAD